MMTPENEQLTTDELEMLADIAAQLRQNPRVRSALAAALAESDAPDAGYSAESGAPYYEGHKRGCGCQRCRGYQQCGGPVTWIPIPWINPCWWMTWCPPVCPDTRCHEETGLPRKPAGKGRVYTGYSY